jgi:hypothetical protein
MTEITICNLWRHGNGHTDGTTPCKPDLHTPVRCVFLVTPHVGYYKCGNCSLSGAYKNNQLYYNGAGGGGSSIRDCKEHVFTRFNLTDKGEWTAHLPKTLQ